jgi:general secretion pathway protein G
MTRTSTSRRRRAGFTLVEVLIAIAIVAILGGLVAVNFIGTEDRQKPRLAQIEMDSIEDALRQFRIAFGRYPSEDEGLAVLWDKDAFAPEDEALSDEWTAFLEDAKPNDVWGNEWGYRAESEYDQDYDLWSNGPDGEEGTDDDITNWDEDAELGGGSGSLLAD